MGELENYLENSGVVINGLNHFVRDPKMGAIHGRYSTGTVFVSTLSINASFNWDTTGSVLFFLRAYPTRC